MNRIRWWVRCLAEIAVQLGVMCVVEWSVRRKGLPATCRRLGIELRMEGSAAGQVGTVPRRYRATVRASGVVVTMWPFGDTCLRRCLLLGHRLRDAGPVLRIGIRPVDAGVLAHSWLEIDGRALDPTAAEFSAMQQVSRRTDDPA